MRQSPQGDLNAQLRQALELAKSGQRAEAITALRALQLAAPSSAELPYHIGRLEAESGAREAAASAFRAALKLRPAEAAIWQAMHGVLPLKERGAFERKARQNGIHLGSEKDLRAVYALLSQAKAQEAEAQALTEVRRAPMAAGPALALGQARLAQGRWAGAVPPLETALARDPVNPAIRFALGQALARLQKVTRAEPLLAEQGLKPGPASVPLARLYIETLRVEEADALLQAAARAAPRDRAIQAEIAMVKAALCDANGALSAAGRATLPGAARADLLRNVAHRLAQAGAPEDVTHVLDAALAEAPDHPAILTQRAQSRQSDGDLDGAEADLLAVIAAAPKEGEAYRAYVNGRRIKADDPILAQIDAQIAAPDLPRVARSNLHFAAAKARGDIGDRDAVFGHLHKANRLMAEEFPYDLEADIASARDLVADWKAHLANMDPAGPDDPVLFVTGIPRSGTTLVETILSAHPDVVAGGEMTFLRRALHPAIDAIRDGQFSPQAFADAGARYLRAARRRASGAPIIADKSIPTFSRVGHTARALPGARFVILKRDPRDVGLSIYRNLFPEGQHRYAYDLHALGRYIRLHDALVSFWADALPDQVHIVDYAKLTADPEPQIRALVAFCNLPWDDACLSPETNTRRVETLSFASARQPINAKAVGGWQRYETELAPLIEALDGEIDLDG